MKRKEKKEGGYLDFYKAKPNTILIQYNFRIFHNTSSS